MVNKDFWGFYLRQIEIAEREKRESFDPPKPHFFTQIKKPLSFTTITPNNNNKKRPTHMLSMSMEVGIGVMGTKLGMMSYFNGKVVPVTVVGFREGNIVTQIKTTATDGYDSVQVGYKRVRDKKLTKPEMGHLEKSGIIPLRHLQEFRLQDIEGFETGQKLAFEELFKEGHLQEFRLQDIRLQDVDVSGTTIGKGFQDDRFWRWSGFCGHFGTESFIVLNSESIEEGHTSRTCQERQIDLSKPLNIITPIILNAQTVSYRLWDNMKLMDDMAALRPTIFYSVPRLYNRIYAG